MFGDSFAIQQSSFYYFEKEFSSNVSGYNVFVKHKFWYWKFIETHTTDLVSITLDDDPPPTPKLTLSLVAKEWKLNSHLQVRAWKLRAEQLNSRPVPGLFDEIPEPIVHVDQSKLLRNDLKDNWLRIFLPIQRAMLSKRRLLDSNRLVSIGLERVRIGKCVYQQM